MHAELVPASHQVPMLLTLLREVHYLVSFALSQPVTTQVLYNCKDRQSESNTTCKCSILFTKCSFVDYKFCTTTLIFHDLQYDHDTKHLLFRL